MVKICCFTELLTIELWPLSCSLVKTRSDRGKLFHYWSKMKSKESQNKNFLFIASYIVHLVLEGFLHTFSLNNYCI